MSKINLLCIYHLRGLTMIAREKIPEMVRNLSDEKIMTITNSPDFQDFFRTAFTLACNYENFTSILLDCIVELSDESVPPNLKCKRQNINYPSEVIVFKDNLLSCAERSGENACNIFVILRIVLFGIDSYRKAQEKKTNGSFYFSISFSTFSPGRVVVSGQIFLPG